MKPTFGRTKYSKSAKEYRPVTFVGKLTHGLAGAIPDLLSGSQFREFSKHLAFQNHNSRGLMQDSAVSDQELLTAANK